MNPDKMENQIENTQTDLTSQPFGQTGKGVSHSTTSVVSENQRKFVSEKLTDKVIKEDLVLKNSSTVEPSEHNGHITPLYIFRAADLKSYEIEAISRSQAPSVADVASLSFDLNKLNVTETKKDPSSPSHRGTSQPVEHFKQYSLSSKEKSHIASCATTEREDLPVDSEVRDSKPDPPCPVHQDGVLTRVIQVFKSVFITPRIPILTQYLNQQSQGDALASAHTTNVQKRKQPKRSFFPKWWNNKVHSISTEGKLVHHDSKPNSPCPLFINDVKPEDGLGGFTENAFVEDMQATTGPFLRPLEKGHCDEVVRTVRSYSTYKDTCALYTSNFQKTKLKRWNFFSKWQKRKVHHISSCDSRELLADAEHSDSKPDLPYPVVAKDIIPDDGFEEFEEIDLIADMQATTGPSLGLVECCELVRKVKSYSIYEDPSSAYTIKEKKLQRRSLSPKWRCNKANSIPKYKDNPLLTENLTEPRRSLFYGSADNITQIECPETPLPKRIRGHLGFLLCY